MNITITARKTTIKDSFREKVEKKLKKFDRFFEDEAKVVVTVTNERERETVEITVRSAGMLYRAERTTGDRLDSLDEVCDVLFHQIVKNKNRLADRMRTDAFANLDAEVAEVEAEADYDIVKKKKFIVHPMSVEEAVLQMNLLGHSFFMFQNSETGEFNTVYHRHDNTYGLIEPIL